MGHRVVPFCEIDEVGLDPGMVSGFHLAARGRGVGAAHDTSPAAGADVGWITVSSESSDVPDFRSFGGPFPDFPESPLV